MTQKDLRKATRTIFAIFFCLALTSFLSATASLGDELVANPDDPEHQLELFTAVWNAAGEETTLRLEDDLGSFHAALAQLAAEGLQLDDLETWPTGDGRAYGGLFRAGGAAREVRYELTSAGLAASLDELAADDYHLIDLEVWSHDGELRYAGVWAEGAGPATVETSLLPRQLHQRRAQLAAGQHLVDFELFEHHGQPHALGVWHPGPEPAGDLALLLDWPSFVSTARARTEAGKLLMEVEVLGAGESARYSGRWVAGSAADWLGDHYLREQLIKANNHLSAGFGTSGLSTGDGFFAPQPTAERLHLIDFEARFVTGDGSIVAGQPLHDAGTAGPPDQDGP